MDRGKAISIHALREEGDASCRCSRLVNERFLSTPSARRATGATGIVDPKDNISIHALREEGDKAADGVCDDRDVFLSTPSARRATL